MLLGRLKRGELRVCEILIKTKKNRRFGLLNYTQVFTRVEGGIGGPNPPNGALGSPVKTSRNLFRKNQTSILVYVFYDYFYVVCTGHRTLNSFRSGAKNSTIQ